MSVITALEQEHGTELEIVPTQLRHATEGKRLFQLNLLNPVVICHENISSKLDQSDEL